MRPWRASGLRGVFMEGTRAPRLAVIVGLLVLAIGPRAAYAVTAQDNGYYVEATQTSWNQLPFCNAPDCTAYSTDGAEVPNSYYGVAQMVAIQQAQDGEVYQWQAILPDGTINTLHKLTYSSQYQCFTWDTGQQTCNTSGHIVAWDGPQQLTGAPGGTWKIDVFDNGVRVVEHWFTLDPPVISTLIITSPVQNQLIDLAADKNYAGTDPTCATPPDTSNYVNSACFAAQTSTGNPVNWTVTLNYQTTTYQQPTATATPAGTRITDTRNFQTDGFGTPYNVAYTNKGGQVVATATSTAADGSTLTQSVTFYIEGPVGGIPGPPTPTNPADVITPVLDNLYTNSYAYKLDLLGDPYGNTTTPDLMTGVAYHETQYRQFTSPTDNPHNSDLYPGVDGKWPNENTDTPTVGRGVYIGLMQARTASDQSADPNAWNWNQNATDGVAIFSNGNSTVPDKVQEAVRYEDCLVDGCGSGKTAVPAHIDSDGKTHLRYLTATERENNALVLYGGYMPSSCTGNTSCKVNYLYYFANCSGTTTNRGGTTQCSTDWQWIPNTQNQLDGLDYVSNGNDGVRDHLY